MKKRIFTLLFTSALLFASCSSDDLTLEEMVLAKSEQDAIVKLVADDLMIIKSAAVTISDVKLKKNGETYYLSLRHGDGITNVLLRVENKNMLRYGGLKCVSQACSGDEEGCMPDKAGKMKCTPCAAGDCTKIVEDINSLEY